MGMEALKNLKLVEAARTEAHVLVADGRIEEHPLLLAQLESRASSLHFE
jgi:hypothetical protein